MKKHFLLAFCAFLIFNNVSCMDKTLLPDIYSMEGFEMTEDLTLEAVSNSFNDDSGSLSSNYLRSFILSKRGSKDGLLLLEALRTPGKPISYILRDYVKSRYNLISTRYSNLENTQDFGLGLDECKPFYMWGIDTHDQRAISSPLISKRISEINKNFLTIISCDLNYSSLENKKKINVLRRSLLETLVEHYFCFSDSFLDLVLDVNINMSKETFKFLNEACNKAAFTGLPNLEIRLFHENGFVEVTLAYLDKKLSYMRARAFDRLLDLLNRAIYASAWFRKEFVFSGAFSNSTIHIAFYLYYKLELSNSSNIMKDL